MAVAKHPSREGTISYNCSTDLSAAQYHAVKLSGANTVAIADADGDLAVGILMNKPDGTYITTAEVGCVPGHSYPAYAGEALATVGTPVTADASGHIIAASDNDVVFGTTETTAGAAADIVQIKFNTPYVCSNVSIVTTGS